MEQSIFFVDFGRSKKLGSYTDLAQHLLNKLACRCNGYCFIVQDYWQNEVVATETWSTSNFCLVQKDSYGFAYIHVYIARTPWMSV